MIAWLKSAFVENFHRLTSWSCLNRITLSHICLGTPVAKTTPRIPQPECHLLLSQFWCILSMIPFTEDVTILWQFDITVDHGNDHDDRDHGYNTTTQLGSIRIHGACHWFASASTFGVGCIAEWPSEHGSNGTLHLGLIQLSQYSNWLGYFRSSCN